MNGVTIDCHWIVTGIHRMADSAICVDDIEKTYGFGINPIFLR